MKLWLIFLTPICLMGAVMRPLTHRDVRLTMREMFAYHVEQKEFTPLIVKRSFKVYIEQFDPEQIYLTQSEVEPFLSPGEKRVKKVIDEYHRDDFREYYALSRMFRKAVKRSRQLRRQIEAEALTGNIVAYDGRLPPGYARNEAELKQRIRLHLMQSIYRDQTRRKIETATREVRAKMVAFWEKKRQHAEAEYYKSEQPEHTLVLHILKALAKSLDAHTAYYSPDEAYEIRAMLQKQLMGIGVAFREEFDGVFVSEVIDGGPAKESGAIAPGDKLVSVDGRSVDESSFSDVLAALKGAEGSKVVLTFLRNGKSFQVKLRRAKIIMEDQRLKYTYEPVANGIIGKIDLPAFYDNGGSVSVERDLRNALRELKTKGELKGVVIDMRHNTGGFLNQAVKVAGLFLTGGVIVISQYSDGEMSYSRDVDGRYYYGGPLVILTSKGSASAAEIVAQSLQDHGVALIIGDERTYGKGSMQYQTITDERAEAFFKVTVGRYYTASGRSPQIEGVQADVHVPTIFSRYLIGERYLEYPISADRLASSLVSTGRHVAAADVVPYLKPRESSYRQMIPSLSTNTHFRLDHNRNFSYYLKLLDGHRPSPPKRITRKSFRETNFGVVDLQLQEAVNIVKDMVYLNN